MVPHSCGPYQSHEHEPSVSTVVVGTLHERFPYLNLLEKFSLAALVLVHAREPALVQANPYSECCPQLQQVLTSLQCGPATLTSAY